MGNIDMREYCFSEAQIKALKTNVKNVLHEQYMVHKGSLCYSISSLNREVTILVTGEKRFSILLLVDDVLREYGLFFCKRNKKEMNNGVVPFTDFDWLDSDGVSSLTILF